MICPICQQEQWCDCNVRVGLAAAVLGVGDPSEAMALHKKYGKGPHYQKIITAARKLAYEGQEAMRCYLDDLTVLHRLIPKRPAGAHKLNMKREAKHESNQATPR